MDTKHEVLAARLDHHAQEEGKILAAYRVLSEKLGEDSIGFLVNLIVTEEEMHHLLFSTMSSWLREALPEPAIAAGEREELLARTRELQVHERETLDECRELRRGLSGGDSELLELLIDVINLDSEKHARILAALEKMLEE